MVLSWLRLGQADFLVLQGIIPNTMITFYYIFAVLKHLPWVRLSAHGHHLFQVQHPIWMLALQPLWRLLPLVHFLPTDVSYGDNVRGECPQMRLFQIVSEVHWAWKKSRNKFFLLRVFAQKRFHEMIANEVVVVKKYHTHFHVFMLFSTLFSSICGKL